MLWGRTQHRHVVPVPHDEREVGLGCVVLGRLRGRVLAHRGGDAGVATPVGEIVDAVGRDLPHVVGRDTRRLRLEDISQHREGIIIPVHRHGFGPRVVGGDLLLKGVLLCEGQTPDLEKETEEALRHNKVEELGVDAAGEGRVDVVFGHDPARVELGHGGCLIHKVVIHELCRLKLMKAVELVHRVENARGVGGEGVRGGQRHSVEHTRNGQNVGNDLLLHGGVVNEVAVSIGWLCPVPQEAEREHIVHGGESGVVNPFNVRQPVTVVRVHQCVRSR
mmetsp:Transcript_31537/g.68179  ORF Transcript_31537/g.68179 Transcript_31537/m.68179 type:complete len:277 (+) Transcript_31537:812-1642(+)